MKANHEIRKFLFIIEMFSVTILVNQFSQYNRNRFFFLISKIQPRSYNSHTLMHTNIWIVEHVQ